METWFKMLKKQATRPEANQASMADIAVWVRIFYWQCSREKMKRDFCRCVLWAGQVKSDHVPGSK